ncbi:trna delta -isopentenylpyrophosphate transferase, partial [Methylobacterium radiotolerans]
GDLKRRIDAAETINAVTDLMLDGATQAVLATMPPGTRDEVRDYEATSSAASTRPRRSTRSPT